MKLVDGMALNRTAAVELEDGTTVGLGVVVGTIVLELINGAILAMKLVDGMALNKAAAVELEDSTTVGLGLVIRTIVLELVNGTLAIELVEVMVSRL